MKTENLYDVIDFQFGFSEEMNENSGEDSFYHEINEQGSVVSVFDGNNGWGANIYENFHGKTGAYMASRIVCGAAKKWFSSICDSESQEVNADTYKELIGEAFKVVGGYEDNEDVVVSKETGKKPFPTSIVLALSKLNEEFVETNFVWSGNARGYILDMDGMHRITKDDADDEEAISNVPVSGATEYGRCDLHTRKLTLKKPSVIFCATDGCFKCFATPMEFENLILETLMKSDSPDEWKQHLKESFKSVASDDYTVSLMATGFNDFDALKRNFYNRKLFVENKYIRNLEDMPYEEKVDLWNTYRMVYENY